MAEVNMPNQTNEVTKNDAGLDAMNIRPGDPGYSGNTLKEQAAKAGKPVINASLPKAEEPKPEPEKSLAKKIFGTFLPGDMKTARKYVKEKILGPDLAQLAFKIFTNMLSMLLFDKPTAGSPSVGTTTTPTTTQPNGAVYKHYSTHSTAPQAQPIKPVFDVKTINFDSYDDVERLIKILNDIAREHSKVTLADLLENCGFASTASSNRWGWYHINGYSTFEDSEGNIHLEMPNMTYFNN